MASFNKVILMGNLTRDPELRYTAGGTAVLTLGLAVNKTYKTQSGELREEPCFIDVTVWGKQAESCNNYLEKGSNIFVDGELKQDSWVDQATGQNKYRHGITANSIRFVGAPKKSGENQQPAQPSYTDPNQSQANQTPSGMPAQMPQS